MNKVLVLMVATAISGAAVAGGEPEFGDLFEAYERGELTEQPARPQTSESAEFTDEKRDSGADIVASDSVDDELLSPDIQPAQPPEPERKEVAANLFGDDSSEPHAVDPVEVAVEPEVDVIDDVSEVPTDLFVGSEDDLSGTSKSDNGEAAGPYRYDPGEDKEDLLLFEEAIRSGEPLTPSEIRAYNYYQDQLERAKADKPNGEPLSTTRSVPVSLSPGAPHPEIHVSDNYVTSVVVLDMLGNPWPIKGYAVGNNEAFRTTAAGDNILMISPLKPYATGNVVVTLKDKTVPVVFQIKHSRERVDFRLEAKIQEIGPEADYNANMDLAFMPGDEDKILQSVLDGAPDASLIELSVTGGSRYTRAWRDKDGSVFLRTPYALKWPEVRAQSRSSDGTNVYKFDSTPVATITVNGKPVLLDINEREY